MKPIERKWKEKKHDLVPREYDQVKQIEMRNAFYIGFISFIELLKETDLNQGDIDILIHEIVADIEEYGQGLTNLALTV